MLSPPSSATHKEDRLAILSNQVSSDEKNALFFLLSWLVSIQKYLQRFLSSLSLRRNTQKGDNFWILQKKLSWPFFWLNLEFLEFFSLETPFSCRSFQSRFWPQTEKGFLYQILGETKSLCKRVSLFSTISLQSSVFQGSPAPYQNVFRVERGKRLSASSWLLFVFCCDIDVFDKEKTIRMNEWLILPLSSNKC